MIIGVRTDPVKKYLCEAEGGPLWPSLRMDDLASLVAGVKEVVYACVKDRAETRVMEELCADLKLERMVLGPAKPASAGGVDVLIGSNTRKLRRAAKYYDQPGSFEWGAALDYPECCVRSYVQWRFLPRRRDLVAFIYAATPAGRPISFLLNNVYNFYSRLFEKDDGAAYGRFCGLNSGFDREPVLPWHPCSYACSGSLAGGRRIFEVLERYMPGLAAARRETLSKPVLFRDKYLFAALEACGPRGAYRLAERPRSLLGGAELKRLAGLPVPRGAAFPTPPKGWLLLPFTSGLR